MYNRKRRKATAGYYIAVALCLCGIGIAAIITYTNFTKTPVKEDPLQISFTVSAQSAASEPARSEPENTEKKTQQTSQAEESKPMETKVQSEASQDVNRSEAPEISETQTANHEGASGEAEQGTVPADTEPQTPPPQPSVFQRPVGTEISKAYSDAPVYSETFRDYRSHKGVDYTAQRGDVVHAIAAGTVLRTYIDAYLGNVIEIEHGAYTARYCGLGSTFLCRAGETVTVGEAIGSILEVPQEIIEGNHLHLEVTRDGTAIDPETLFGS